MFPCVGNAWGEATLLYRHTPLNLCDDVIQQEVCLTLFSSAEETLLS
jgi:hypothetical protein